MAAEATTPAPATASPGPVSPVPATTEQPTEQHVEVIEAAGNNEDNGSDLDPIEFDAESANTSITSSIYKHSYENGRR